MTCVSMGNPHVVVFMDEPMGEFPLTEIGQMVEHHRLFPARVNFEFVNVLDGGSVLKTRVWERGSGITMARGTGACAEQEGFMEDVSSPETNRQHRERRRRSESSDKRQTFSKRPKYLKADSWSILFRATPV